MKSVTYFYINFCPYCKNADRAIKELCSENEEYKKIEIRKINEDEHPEISEKYNYYYVPTFFVDGKKEYEAHPGESYEDCKKTIKRIFDSLI